LVKKVFKRVANVRDDYSKILRHEKSRNPIFPKIGFLYELKKVFRATTMDCPYNIQ